MTTFIKRQNSVNIKEHNIFVNKNDSNSLFKFNIENYNILSFLMNNKKEISALENTHSNSLTSFNFDYEENSVKKFDEFNMSLNNISLFDLEEEEKENDGNSSFNSLDYSLKEENNEENEEIEQILEYELDILQKEDENDDQYETELKKDYEQIEKEILEKNSKSN
jgi:hypothetical protein